jgi:hypothetical protein
VSTTLPLAAALWGLALLAACVGWGRSIAAALRVRAGAHVGLELVWGFAALLAMGGWLCWLGIAARPVLAGLVALGLAGCLLPRARARQAPRVAAPGIWLPAFALGVAGLLGLVYATGLLDPRYHPPDDQAAYFLHARQILETGSLHEPFSFRRMASYGGQSFLHALVLVVAPIEQLNLLDRGVCRVAVGIALLAHVLARPERSLLAALVVVYVTAAYWDVTQNTSSIFSGVLAFSGLWMTLEHCRRVPQRPVASGILTGLALAATLPLRHNYALACALVVGFEHARRFRSARDPGQGRELLVAGGAAALGAGGWALLQLDACGTPLFPLWRGFANPEWGRALSARSPAEFATALGSYLYWPILSVQLGLAALALWPPSRAARGGSLLAPLAGATLIAFTAQAWLLAHVHPRDSLRYAAAFLLPAVLFASARAAETLARVRSWAALRDDRLWLCVIQLLLLLWQLPPPARLAERVGLRRELEPSARMLHAPLKALRYARLQDAAPAGEKLLVLLDDPYLLDLRRNDVASLDLPGGVSPPPGLWRLDTAEEVAGYFRGLGYSWLATVRPERTQGVYALETWTAHANGVRQRWHYHPSDTASWQILGRTVTHFFRQLDALIAGCRLVREDRELVMIDLARCRFEPPPR